MTLQDVKNLYMNGNNVSIEGDSTVMGDFDCISNPNTMSDTTQQYATDFWSLRCSVLNEEGSTVYQEHTRCLPAIFIGGIVDQLFPSSGECGYVGGSSNLDLTQYKSFDFMIALESGKRLHMMLEKVHNGKDESSIVNNFSDRRVLVNFLNEREML